MARAGHHSERLDSEHVHACKDILDGCSFEEARVIQKLAASRAAAVAGHTDHPKRKLEQRKAELELALLEANERHYTRHGRDLVTVEDYYSVRRPGEPSYKAFHTIFGTWPRAKVDAGLPLISYPEAHLAIREGGQSTSRRQKFDHIDFVKAIALCMEHHGGLTVSTRQYKDWQLAYGPTHPTYNQIIGAGPGGQKRKWGDLRGAAIEWILANPGEFPVGHARLNCLRTTGQKAAR